MQERLIQAVEAFLAALRSATTESVAATTPTSNAVYDYDGSDDLQNLVDVARRFVRYSRTGKAASKAERKLARKVIKRIKVNNDILNTNGHDIWTLNGL